MTEESKQEQTPEEKPVFSPVDEQPEAKVDIDGIIGLLEKANISDPKQLEGKLQNAAGYQKVQSSLSQTEQRLRALEQENAKLTESLTAGQTRHDIDDFGEPRGVTEDDIRRVLREEKAAERKQAMEAQQAQLKAYKRITTDKHYNVVRDAFESRMKDPETAYLLQAGEMNPIELYQDTVVDFYRDTSQKALEALKGFKGSAKVAPPHVEGSARVPDQSQGEDDPKAKKIQELRKRSKKPGGLHEDEQMDMINTELADFIGR